MRYIQLLEYNEDRVLRELNQKFEQKKNKDHSLKHDSIIKLARDVRSQDPTNGKYTFWILNRYVNDGIRFYEDIISKAIPAIEKHLKLSRQKKLKPEHRDANRFKSLDALMDAMDGYQNEISNKEKTKGIEQELIDNDEVEILHNDSEYKLVTPKTERASCYYGTNTRWCTASKARNMFDDYNNKGSLYILLHKPTNTRWQLHFQENQFMDEKDRRIDYQKFINEHPRVLDIMSPIAEKNQSVVFNKNPSEKVQMAAVRKNGNMIRYIENPSNQVKAAAVEKNGFSIFHIENPDNSLVINFLSEYPSEQHKFNVPGDVMKKIIQKNPLAIQHFDEASEETKELAVRLNGRVVLGIPNPSENLLLIAITANPRVYGLIKHKGITIPDKVKQHYEELIK